MTTIAHRAVVNAVDEDLNPDSVGDSDFDLFALLADGLTGAEDADKSALTIAGDLKPCPRRDAQLDQHIIADAGWGGRHG